MLCISILKINIYFLPLQIYNFSFLGPDFEARIRQNEINNKKFNFLNIGDPYNAYYQHKVKEFKEGKGGSKLILINLSATENSIYPPNV